MGRGERSVSRIVRERGDHGEDLVKGRSLAAPSRLQAGEEIRSGVAVEEGGTEWATSLGAVPPPPHSPNGLSQDFPPHRL